MVSFHEFPCGPGESSISIIRSIIRLFDRLFVSPSTANCNQSSLNVTKPFSSPEDQHSSVAGLVFPVPVVQKLDCKTVRSFTYLRANSQTKGLERR